MFDFPSSPTLNQEFAAGSVMYKFNGTGWAVKSAVDTFVDAAGDTMTGLLTLSGDPSTALQAAPKQYVDAVRTYAAPFDAMAYSGMQVNGSMEVSQESGTTNVSLPAGVGAKYIVDGFYGANLGATRTGVAVQQAISSIAGFSNALGFTCLTPAALATGDAQYVFQPIEGYRWSRLAFGTASAQSVTISFWVFAPVTGTMAVTLRNVAANRCYVVDVPITTANVWQYKTVTIPGCVDGTWASNNTIGATVTFCFGAGATYKGAPNTWLTSNAFATTSTTNFWSAANTVYLTGVVVLPGPLAPTAAQSPLIMRPYNQELVTCQRYYEKRDGTPLIWTGPAVSGNSYSVASDFLVPKRATPTMTFTFLGGWSFPGGSPTTVNASLYEVEIEHAANGTNNPGFYKYNYAADARL